MFKWFWTIFSLGAPALAVYKFVREVRLALIISFLIGSKTSTSTTVYSSWKLFMNVLVHTITWQLLTSSSELFVISHPKNR